MESPVELREPDASPEPQPPQPPLRERLERLLKAPLERLLKAPLERLLKDPLERLLKHPLGRTFKHPWMLLSALIFAGIVAGCLTTFLVVYFKFAAMIDQRLAEGAFSSAVGIYSAPRRVIAGESMTRDELLDRLRRAGYTPSPDNPSGSFSLDAAVVEIRPGADSLMHPEPARIEFAHDRISQIISLSDNSVLKDYVLDPQLMANVSENREKRTLVRFNDIPQSLVDAVVSVEDKRFFKHIGFDPMRIVKAAYIDLRDGGKHQGASTLSMQLARSLWLDRDKVWKRKLSEMFITLHLEMKLTKQQIFEDYANQVYLGDAAPSTSKVSERPRARFSTRTSRRSVPPKPRCSPVSSSGRVTTTRSATPSGRMNAATWCLA